jgi:hypothetical protein
VSFLRPTGLMTEPPQEHDINLTTSVRLRHRQRYQGLPLAEAGRHIFQVELWDEAQQRWNHVASVPLEINFQPPQ